MSKESLHEAIAQLHAELRDTPQLDDEARGMLQRIVGDIGPGPETGAHAPRLEALAARFEADHPSLAASLRGIADALGRIGL
ncbi:MAG: DUF4404 family protein [Steroidobacteraceae bacterium]